MPSKILRSTGSFCQPSLSSSATGSGRTSAKAQRLLSLAAVALEECRLAASLIVMSSHNSKQTARCRELPNTLRERSLTNPSSRQCSKNT